MKKTDYAMIVLVAGISLLISYFVMNSIPLFSDASKPVSVKTADPISPDVGEIDAKIFNKKAINPTVEIYIGRQTSPILSGSDESSTDDGQ